MDEDVRGLNALARHHWSWISESFLHVLVLQEWGERSLSDRITEQYFTEIPRAFRLIEIILESDIPLTLGDGEKSDPQWLPDPGRSARAMRERERALIGSFDDRLRDLSVESIRAGQHETAALAEEALASRHGYVEWLSSEVLESAQWIERSSRIPEDANAAWLNLNRVLLHLLAAIDETTVHMLVLRHRGDFAEAERSWQAGFHCMLLATEIVRLFARHEWAFELRTERTRRGVKPPSFCSMTPDVRERNRERRLMLKDACEEAVLQLSALRYETEIDAEVKAMLLAVGERVARLPYSSQPEGPNFESMMERFPYHPTG